MTLVDTPFTALERVIGGFEDINQLLTALDCLTDHPPHTSDGAEQLRGANAVTQAIRRRLDDLEQEAAAAFPVEMHGLPIDFGHYVAEAKSQGGLAPYADYIERVAGVHGYQVAVAMVCRLFRDIRVLPRESGQEGSDD